MLMLTDNCNRNLHKITEAFYTDVRYKSNLVYYDGINIAVS
jgi:hypothetical protein